MNDRSIDPDGLYREAYLLYEIEKHCPIIPYPMVKDTSEILRKGKYLMKIVTDAHS